MTNEQKSSSTHWKDYLNNRPSPKWYAPLINAYRHVLKLLARLTPVGIYQYLLKWPWQRLTQGFDDRATWSLDHTIAKFILPRLKHYNQTTHSYPASLATSEQWFEYVNQMIWSFEYALANYDTYDDSECDWHDLESRKYHASLRQAQQAKDYKKFEEGMNLFAKYYANLWD